MEMALAITSYHRLSPRVETHKTLQPSDQCLLGRSSECDWHLPDPERAVSSRHAELFWDDGRFWIRDTSTNGVFLNEDSQPLGRGTRVPLNDGDGIRCGDYEIAVSMKARYSEPAVEPSMDPPGNDDGADVAAFSEGVPAHALEAGRNPTLASGLDDHRLDDAHVDVPDVSIPGNWSWDESASNVQSKSQPRDPSTDQPPDAADMGGADLARAFMDGLGLAEDGRPEPTEALFREFGALNRHLLDHLLELMRARALKKQQLRVQQTLFQQVENNPLKFSASAADAIDALVLRRHRSFLDAESAIREAFEDIRSHEEALLAGMEAVMADVLSQPLPSDGSQSRVPLLGKLRAYSHWQQHLRQLRQRYRDRDGLLRSEAFAQAYESASEEESGP